MNKILVGALIALLVISVVLGIYAFVIAPKSLNEMELKLAEQMKIVTSLREDLTASQAAEAKVREDAEKDRATLSAEIEILKADKVGIQQALAKEKEKTATLTNGELAISLGTFIGAEEVKELKAGGFSLTRPGGENSLNIFKSYTWSIAEWDKDKAIIAKQNSQITSYETVTIPSYKRDIETFKRTLDQTDFALSLSMKATDAAKREATRKFVKGLAYGVGGTSVIVLVLELIGGFGK